MATDITPFIEKIENAIYGKDVRSSIVESIKKINDDNNKYDDIKNKVVDLHDKTSRLKNDTENIVRNANNVITDATSKTNTLRPLVDDATLKISSLTSKNSDANTKISSLREENTKATSNIKSMESKSEELRILFSNIESSKEELNSSTQNASEKLNIVTSKNTEISRLIDEASKSTSTLKSNISEASAKIESLRNENGGAYEKAKAYTDEKLGLKADKSELSSYAKVNEVIPTSQQSDGRLLGRAIIKNIKGIIYEDEKYKIKDIDVVAFKEYIETLSKYLNRALNYAVRADARSQILMKNADLKSKYLYAIYNNDREFIKDNFDISKIDDEVLDKMYSKKVEVKRNKSGDPPYIKSCIILEFSSGNDSKYGYVKLNKTNAKNPSDSDIETIKWTDDERAKYKFFKAHPYICTELKSDYDSSDYVL